MSAMRGALRRLLSAAPRSGSADPVPVQLRLAQMPALSFVVGDIHGRLDLYRKLEMRITDEAAGGPVLIVLLGDLVDRGPESAGLIDFLMALPPSGVQRMALMGNHEQMMLRYFEAPKTHARWLDYGGRETLASYGIYGDPARGFDLPERRLMQMFDASIPAEHIAWLRALPCALHLGPSYFLSHAGIDPDKSLAAQEARDLMWARGMTAPPPEGITVIHGHTPVEIVDLSGPYIDVDTGAYATGRLSALRLVPGRPPDVVEIT